ncbi:MAG: ABC-type transport system involved in multi-copper enzyme maturation permease subunit [Rickettsiales bacterium]|jgi:ABC-type transport system involved in multi-copper enzyme maturation permease subunit
MISILRYVLMTAMRDWLYVGVVISLLVAFGISVLIGSSAFSENNQFSIVYVAGSGRILFAIGIIIFICFNIRKSFDNREIEFFLSKSISRSKFILSYILGFFIVSIFALLPLIILISILPEVNYLGLFFWSLSITLESLIFISFAILASFIFKSAVFSVLASFGFYVMSRMMGFFVMNISFSDSIYNFNSFGKFVTKIISTIIPRLDLFAKSEWLIYGANISYTDLLIILLQSIIYVFLMIFMCFFDFNRKQF